MKRVGIIFGLLFLSLSWICAETVFVTAKICPVLEEADFSSKRILLLKNGEELELLGKEGNWVKIRRDNREGYVQKIFLNTSANVVAAERSLDEFANLDVRKRASVYSSSAAAIRGLNAENVRERENLKFQQYDFESVKWVEENFSYLEEEVVNFFER